MGKNKKKRERKINIFIALEGNREEVFLDFLQELFDPQKTINLNYPDDKGGNSNAILDRALKSVYSKNYAWFDEDGELDTEHKKTLENRWHVKFPKNTSDSNLQFYNNNMCNPIVVVSTPLSVEGILIRLFNHNMPPLLEPIRSEENFKENKNRMKSSVKGFMGDLPDIEYYRLHLTKKKILEKAKEINELRLLLTIFGIKVSEEVKS